jgi:hypothetical protein
MPAHCVRLRGAGSANLPPPTSAAFRVGDWVVAPYRGAGERFPGKIIAVDGRRGAVKYTVQYADGDKDTLPEAGLVPIEVRVRGLWGKGIGGNGGKESLFLPNN